MKVTPRSLLAPKELTLPSGLTVRVLGSPDLAKLVRMGKVPLPLVKKVFETSETGDIAEPEDVTTDHLALISSFQAALVCAVVEAVHYIDEDGTVYDMPLTLDADSDDHYPYDLLSSDDSDYIYGYAQEGVVPLAAFPDTAGSPGASEGGAVLESKTKRTRGAKPASV